MNSIQVFSNQDFSVRTYTDENGEVWFVAKDVCDMLGIVNARDAVSELDDDEKMTVANTDGHSGQRGGAQSYNVINEAGLYKLTFKSRKPDAKKFTRWVTHEVLPTLRKTGRYSIQEKAPAQAVAILDKKPLPQTSAPIKAADKIYSKAFKAKSEKDFLAVIALDRAFFDTFERSALEIAGLKIERRLVEVPTTFEERLRMPRYASEWTKWIYAYVLVKDGEVISSSADERKLY